MRASLRRRQAGTTLLVALIMLVMLTLFAVSGIRTGNIGLRIVGNQQQQKFMEAAAQEAIEQMVSNLGNFDVLNTVDPSATIAQRICVNGTPPVITTNPGTTACTSGTPVDVSPARCISSTRSQYDSLTQQMATFDNVWQFKLTVTDSISGAKAVYNQGVKMRMLANSCPGIS